MISICFHRFYLSDAGDVHLFYGLEMILVQGLPQEMVEWKRTYGRPPRAVTLSASFKPFDTFSPTKDGVKTLGKLSGSKVLHIFWLECVVSGHFN